MPFGLRTYSTAGAAGFAASINRGGALGAVAVHLEVCSGDVGQFMCMCLLVRSLRVESVK